MPSLDGRAGKICIWLITFFFFISVVGGGSLLILYFALPETKVAPWFPIVGFFLIGIPWISWIFLGIYRCISTRRLPVPADQPSSQPAASELNESNSIEDGQTPLWLLLEVPGDRVRFGNAMAVGSLEGSPPQAITAAGLNSGESSGSPGGAKKPLIQFPKKKFPLWFKGNADILYDVCHNVAFGFFINKRAHKWIIWAAWDPDLNFD